MADGVVDLIDCERELQIARKRQQLIAGFAKDAMEQVELGRLLHETSLRVAQGLHVDHTKVLQYRPMQADLLVVAGVGWRDGVVGHAVLGVDMASPPGRALQTGQPVLIDDLGASEEFTTSPLLAEHAIRSLLNVPLFVNGTAWGVLEVDSSTPRHFTLSDSDFLATFAGIVGAAIQRRLLEQQAADGAAKLAQDREILLSEAQHRLKNNLQMILAVVALQKKQLTDPAARLAFEHITDRITAIALAQDQLVAARGLSEVKTGSYLRALCSYLDPHRADLSIVAEIQDLDLPADQAVPVGLILNETVTNAIKHAFPDGRPGVIRVEFGADPQTGLATLAVSDNGVGMGPPRQGGSGRNLKRALAGQLGGEIHHGAPPEGGARVELRFPARLAFKGFPGDQATSAEQT